MLLLYRITSSARIKTGYKKLIKQQLYFMGHRRMMPCVSTNGTIIFIALSLHLLIDSKACNTRKQRSIIIKPKPMQASAPQDTELVSGVVPYSLPVERLITIKV